MFASGPHLASNPSNMMSLGVVVFERFVLIYKNPMRSKEGGTACQKGVEVENESNQTDQYLAHDYRMDNPSNSEQISNFGNLTTTIQKQESQYKSCSVARKKQLDVTIISTRLMTSRIILLLGGVIQYSQ